MSTQTESIKDFYDGFASKQLKTGINLRHINILNNLKNEGLKRSSKVLEIGCGIGTVTSLIANYTKIGKVVAVDISPESIEVAKKINSRHKNIDFLVSDMKEFKHQIKFDFVVLPDVIEHIPIDQHYDLFKTISSHCHSKSIVCIHIPHPQYHKWLHKNQPESLQILDQVIETHVLLQNIYPHQLYLHKLSSYSVFSKYEDYQWIVLRRNVLQNHYPLLPKLKRKWNEIKLKFL